MEILNAFACAYVFPNPGRTMLAINETMTDFFFFVWWTGVSPRNAFKSFWTRTNFSPRCNGQILERIPAGRWGEAEDIAGAAVFLSSRASDYVHGHVLTVDGGWMGR